MSFDVSVSAQPVIKPAAQMHNDGGGGNLGYMSQGRRQKKQDEKNIFEMGAEGDFFGQPKEVEINEDAFKFTLADFFTELFDAIKSLFVK